MTEPDDNAERDDPRIRLAGERTLLAWVRTGLAMMAFGFVIARVGLFLREIAEGADAIEPKTTGLSLWIGAVMILLGAGVNVVAASQHLKFLRRLDARAPYEPPRFSLSISVAMALAALGVGMTLYLFLIP